MVFSTLTFIFRFLPIFLILYFIVPHRYKNMVLLLGSLFFYTYGEQKFLLLFILSICINYLGAIAQDKARDNQLCKRLFLVIILFYDFGILFFFKYINFAIENVNFILKGIPDASAITPLSVALPLGISFYTFQMVSYSVDVYRGEIKAEKSIYQLALYLCMFPQLISGPIVKYAEIKLQLKYRTNTFDNLEAGFKLFTLGMGCKVLLADRIGLLWNNIQTIGFESISTPLAWLGAIGYSLQLYFDFFGYSLMAIGVGKMMGFSLPDNFTHPYISKSVTEFWRRWHISLGRWFKNYVYIPLGGNRKGKRRLIINLLIVWMFTGLWHGASWNFVLWGFVLFVLICMEKLFLNKFLNRSKILSRFYILIIMPLTWMLFAISNLQEIGTYFGRMFSLVPGICVNSNDFIKYFSMYKWYFIIGIFLCMPFAWNWFKKYDKSIPCTMILLIIFWYAIYQISNGINNPFMYFKF